MAKIEITTVDGKKYVNNPELGLNLSYIEEIRDCLNAQGYYDLCREDKGWKRLTRDDVKDMKMLEESK